MVKIKYLCTREQEEYIDSELKNATHEIINDSMSEYDKVKAINDYMEVRPNESLNDKRALFISL